MAKEKNRILGIDFGSMITKVYINLDGEIGVLKNIESKDKPKDEHKKDYFWESPKDLKENLHNTVKDIVTNKKNMEALEPFKKGVSNFLSRIIDCADKKSESNCKWDIRIGVPAKNEQEIKIYQTFYKSIAVNIKCVPEIYGAVFAIRNHVTEQTTKTNEGYCYLVGDFGGLTNDVFMFTPEDNNTPLVSIFDDISNKQLYNQSVYNVIGKHAFTDLFLSKYDHSFRRAFVGGKRESYDKENTELIKDFLPKFYEYSKKGYNSKGNGVMDDETMKAIIEIDATKNEIPKEDAHRMLNAYGFVILSFDEDKYFLKRKQDKDPVLSFSAPKADYDDGDMRNANKESDIQAYKQIVDGQLCFLNDK